MLFQKKIIHYSEHDLVMRVRLAGISDLIVTEGKYHLKCLVNFKIKHKQRMATPDVNNKIQKSSWMNFVKIWSKDSLVELYMTRELFG